ncbi:helix-turn-helix domain-containing protein [Saccharibacillus sp. JS10]|uniref:helix-turn-helix domain-containing protein n=1 Tax=Saccharibacillus sp. JS10 TaxID=2950552 RepID=UPI00210E1224|nr:helix-turn-helix domain-containing protein [Saccharibacillus sp. JS10]MCQ4087641.1 helix-turn-helix domain-containing protein [Saccharibacillus sp. JS10]
MNRFLEKGQIRKAVELPAKSPRAPFFDSSEPRLGVLNAGAGKNRFRLLRYDPAPELAGFVRHYWTVEWELDAAESYQQEVVPNPCANLVIEHGRTSCYMPSTSRFSHLLQGKGSVFGVKFLPGGFYPFYRESLSELIGNSLPVDRVLRSNAVALEQALDTTNDVGLCELMDMLLLEAKPQMDHETKLLSEIFKAIAGRQDLTKVDELCKLFGIEKRNLQRLFSRRVGLTPKWVIRLHRLQEAAEALDRGKEQGTRTKLLHLSQELGYHDQAHFIKDFKAVIGVTPEAYVLGTRS